MGCRPRTSLTLILGPAGSGKTSLAITLAQSSEVSYWLSPPHTWWDGYDPRLHSTVVFDEFFGQVAPSYVNRLVSPSPVTVNQKGVRALPFRSAHLIIVSNVSPLDWWNNTRVPIASLLRRITRLIVIFDPFPSSSELDCDILSSNNDSQVCPLIKAAIDFYTDHF